MQIKKEIKNTTERKNTEPLNIENVSNNDQVRGKAATTTKSIILSD